MREFKTTEEIEVPKTMMEQVIGQDKAVAIMKKAAKQKRNVLLIGPPGTGKSMLAQAMAELLPSEELNDILVYPNKRNENEPEIISVRTYPDFDYLKKHPRYMAFYPPKELESIKNYTEQHKLSSLPDVLKDGLGRKITTRRTRKKEEQAVSPSILIILLAMIGIGIIFFVPELSNEIKWLALALIFGLAFLYLLSSAAFGLSKRFGTFESFAPKLIVDNTKKKTAPFVDATGTKAGALLGDIKHDPLQSGGLGTPPHLRVEAGAIHKANKGVLFIDEIASLKLHWQHELLTAMQEKRYPITGQSEMSSGALVKTMPVPCDFVLVCAGNLHDLKAVHPALRSRIRGAGYEVYVEDMIDDNEENENKLVQFVAQEVVKDGRIPHFTRDAVIEIVDEARRLSGRKKKFTLNLRELGGLVRAAGDLAKEEGAKHVNEEHVKRARSIFRSIEYQFTRKFVERKKDYQVFLTEGFIEGRVNGLAVFGDSLAGLVLPIVAEVTPPASKSEGKVIATGKLGTIAKEAVENVSAIMKKHVGTDISKKDIHIQFLQTYEGVEGDSASISIAVGVISALEDIPVDQTCAMTGSLDIKGEVLPVGGITGKVEAAIEVGIKKIVLPKSNLEDLHIDEKKRKSVRIIPVGNIVDVLEATLKDSPKKKALITKIRKEFLK